jgi:radical SAM protein with 4Fe4S-binding SPASM domain
MIDLELFESIIERQKRHLMSLILYFQGEPLLHPDFFTLVQIASKARIYTLTSSNGHFFNELNSQRLIEAGLDRLMISVDSFDQEVYSRYRVGGNIEKVKEGIKILLQLRKKTGQKKPVIILQFLVFRDNEKQLHELKRKGYEMGADRVVFKSMQMNDEEGLQRFIPEMNKYSRYRMNQEGNYEIKNRYYNHCWKMWHSSVFTWDGKVLPCCFDKDGQHSLGQIQNGNQFENIWVSDSYRRFRKRILHERKTIDICRNCSEGTKIWI